MHNQRRYVDFVGAANGVFLCFESTKEPTGRDLIMHQRVSLVGGNDSRITGN